MLRKSCEETIFTALYLLKKKSAQKWTISVQIHVVRESTLYKRPQSTGGKQPCCKDDV